MEMPTFSASIADIMPRGGSRIRNSSAVLNGIDVRAARARRYHDVLGQLICDMGGDPSEAQRLREPAYEAEMRAEESPALQAERRIDDSKRTKF